MINPNVWHVIRDGDRERIRCEHVECGKPSLACEHVPVTRFGRKESQFCFFCEDHARERGFTDDWSLDGRNAKREAETPYKATHMWTEKDLRDRANKADKELAEARNALKEERRRRFQIIPSTTGCHTTACSIWGDDGQGGTEENYPQPLPCNCGALQNFEKSVTNQVSSQMFSIRERLEYLINMILDTKRHDHGLIPLHIRNRAFAFRGELAENKPLKPLEETPKYGGFKTIEELAAAARDAVAALPLDQQVAMKKEQAISFATANAQLDGCNVTREGVEAAYQKLHEPKAYESLQQADSAEKAYKALHVMNLGTLVHRLISAHNRGDKVAVDRLKVELDRRENYMNRNREVRFGTE